MLAFEGKAIFGLRVIVQSGNSTALTLRGVTRENPFTFKFTPTGNRSVETFNFRISDAPIWCTVLDENGAFEEGETFVTLDLTIDGDIVHQLFSGYVYQSQGLTWPIADVRRVSPEHGQRVTITGADPAAGAEISVTVPAFTQWKVLAVRFTLVTAAVAANRIVHLIFSRNSLPLYECISNTAQIISLTKNYTCFPTTPGGSAADDNDIIIPIPADIILQDGDTIVTGTTALDVTDNFGAPSVFIERYFTILG